MHLFPFQSIPRWHCHLLFLFENISLIFLAIVPVCQFGTAAGVVLMRDVVSDKKSKEFITEPLALLFERPCSVFFINTLLFGSDQFRVVHAQHVKIITEITSFILIRLSFL